MSYDDLKLPSKLPEPGFYRHYKHDPEMRRADCPDAHHLNYMYRVLPSLGLYTEEDGPADKFRVEYLPLYPWAKVYQLSKQAGRMIKDHRPVSLFVSNVETPSYSGPRFTPVTDRELFELFEAQIEEMWGQFPSDM